VKYDLPNLSHMLGEDAPFYFNCWEAWH